MLLYKSVSVSLSEENLFMPESPKITWGLGTSSEIWIYLSPIDCLLLEDTDVQVLCYRHGIEEASTLYPFCTFQDDYQLLSDYVQGLSILNAEGISTRSLQSFDNKLKLLSTETWICVCSMCTLEYRIWYRQYGILH